MRTQKAAGRISLPELEPLGQATEQSAPWSGDTTSEKITGRQEWAMDRALGNEATACANARSVAGAPLHLISSNPSRR
jgi:hypothetical protein